MSVRYRYPSNGTFFFEDALNHMENDSFPGVYITDIAGITGWFLTINRYNPNGQDLLVPCITTGNGFPAMGCRYYLSFLFNDGTPDNQTEHSIQLQPNRGPVGNGLATFILSDEQKKYLDNGGLTVAFGIKIDSILGPDGVWTFNFHDPLIDCLKKRDGLYFHMQSNRPRQRFFHCHKQLLMFHSTHMKDHPNEIIRICLNGEDTDHFETFLQIAHGVRGRITYEESHLKNAYVFGLWNVKQLIDQELKWQLGPRLSFIDAISDDLNHCVAEWFRAQRNVGGLKKVLSRVDIDVLPGEVMKKCAMFFFGI